MAHGFDDLYQLMPRKDCGSCGNPTCRTMARKIAVGEMKASDCINISPENVRKIDAFLTEGVEIGAKAEVVLGESGITYIHPCVSEAGRVMAEARLTKGPEGEVKNLKYGFFDPYMMCYTLKNCGFFTDVKCSTKLGVAKIEYDGKTIIINHKGKIDVRRARDKEDALTTIRFVGRTLWGAIICMCCGNAGIDCASGGCEDCVDKLCPVLGGGPPQPGLNQEKTKQTTGKTTFIRVDKLETGHLFIEGFVMLKKALERIFNGDLNVDFEIESAARKGMHFIIETPRMQDAALGLILDGICEDVRRIKEGLNDLQGIRLGEKEGGFLKDAEKIVVESFSAFENTDWEKTSEIKEKIYPEYRKRLMGYYKGQSNPETKKALVAMEKIASNGMYVARLVSKPIPA